MRKLKPLEVPKGAILNPAGIDQEGMMFWKNKGNGFHVAICHYTADPKKRTDEWFEEETRNLRPDQIDREYEINFNSRAGEKVFWYLLQTPQRWQIPNIDLNKVPKNWRIIAGLDYGSKVPTSINLYGIDQNRNFYSLWEFYKPSHYKEIARAIKGEHPDYPHPLWKRVEKVMADPSIWKCDQQNRISEEMGSLAELIEEEGIYNLEQGTNNRMAGLERMKDMLNYKPQDENAKPHLFFCKRCVNQWRELTELVYDEIPPHMLMKKNQKEDVVAKDDHAYDSTRYALMSITAPAGEEQEYIPEPEENSLDSLEKELDKRYDDEEEIDFF